jgi:hypothetical protein
VAPDAGLLDLKSYSSDPGSDVTAIPNFISAVEWCTENREEFDIRVISMSVGGLTDDGTSLLSQAAERAINAGITIVAVGNYRTSHLSPNSDGCIKVGFTNDSMTVDRTDDTLVESTSQGPRPDDGDEDPYDELQPDVVAPGMAISAAKWSRDDQATDEYQSMDGVSMAAPHVAGVAALIIQANPDLSPLDVKYILRATAEQRGEPEYPEYPFPHNKWNSTWGYGIVDAYEAVKMALEFTPPSVLESPVITTVPASPDNDGAYELGWTTVDNAVAYVLEEDTDPGFISPAILYDGEGTEYEVQGRDEGTYYYRVMCYNNTDESDWSPSVTVEVDHAVEELEAPVLDEMSSPDTNGRYTVRWSRVSDANMYYLEEATSSDFSDALEVYDGSSTSKDLNGRTDGTYYYRVRAGDGERLSQWSASVSVTVDLGGGDGDGGDGTDGGDGDGGEGEEDELYVEDRDKDEGSTPGFGASLLLIAVICVAGVARRSRK